MALSCQPSPQMSSGCFGSNQGENRTSFSPGNVSLRGRAASRGIVFVQQGHAAEGPWAGATLVLLHFRVCLQVCTQVGAISKGPVTVLASEGTFTWFEERKLLASGKHLINRPKAQSSSHCFSNELQITYKRAGTLLLNADCLFSCITTVRLR